MPNSPRLNWPFPAEYQDPFYDAFKSMVEAQDASAYAAQEDRNILLMGGGTVGFAAPYTVSWTEPLEVSSSNVGFLWTVAAGNVSMDEGQMLSVALVRSPTAGTELVTFVCTSRPPTVDGDDWLVLAIRRNNKIFWRNGSVYALGDSRPFGAGGGGGSGLPPFISQLYSVVVEYPLGSAAFVQLTQDMILPAFLITSFGVSPNVVEVGGTVTNPLFTAAYNRSAGAASINNGVETRYLGAPYTGFIWTGSFTYTTPNAAQSFTLSANETGGPVKTSTAVIYWRPRVYYGVAEPGTYDEAFIEALASNALAGARQRTISYSASGTQKCYYAYPASYGGSPSNFIDTATGFAAGFEKVAAGVTVTNAFGVAMSFDLWASEQMGLGSINIQVT